MEMTVMMAWMEVIMKVVEVVVMEELTLQVVMLVVVGCFCNAGGNVGSDGDDGDAGGVT